MTKNPFKRYQQKLKLWWRFADIQEHQAVPLIAPRLGGLAFGIAMTMRMTRMDELTNVET